jgi:hypothetical protein
MTPLFAQIEHETLTMPHGWATVAKAQMLAAAVLALRPALAIEIGVYAGKSAFPVALAMKEVNHGRLIAIDPWSAQESKVGQINPADHKFWSTLDHDMIYQTFRHHALRLNVAHLIQIERKRSDDFEPPNGIGLLHVDGNHSEQACRDMERFAPKCRVGALLFADDIGWAGGGVARGVEKLKAMGWEQLFFLDTGAVFQKVKG